MFQPGALPTKVVCLTEVVTADDLKDDDEYQDIMVDMKEEGEKFGMLSADELYLILCCIFLSISTLHLLFSIYKQGS